MKKNSSFILFATVCCVFLHTFNSSAHSGRTDSSGGHNCRVGSCAGTYHYHNGGSSSSTYSSTISIEEKKKYCPTNSTGTYPNCNCNDGYVLTPSKTKCYKLPENSHAANNGADLWLCDEGYEEDGDSCVKKVKDVEEDGDESSENQEVESSDENKNKNNNEELKNKINENNKLKKELEDITSKKEELEKQNEKLKDELVLAKKEKSKSEDDDFGSFFGGVASVLVGSWIYKNKIKKS